MGVPRRRSPRLVPWLAWGGSLVLHGTLVFCALSAVDVGSPEPAEPRSVSASWQTPAAEDEVTSAPDDALPVEMSLPWEAPVAEETPAEAEAEAPEVLALDQPDRVVEGEVAAWALPSPIGVRRTPMAPGAAPSTTTLPARGESHDHEVAATVPRRPGPTALARPQEGNQAPAYPAGARRLGVSGVVRLRLEIGPSGRVDEVEVVSSSGSSLLDEAAAATAREWRFWPALEDGVAVSCSLLQSVRFVLGG